MNQAMSKLPPATAASTQKMYNSLLGGQLGVIGETLGGLIDNGQKMMSDNPALANFMRAAGGQPMQFETPDFLKDLAAKAMPQEPAAPVEQAPQQAEPQWMANMTPEMKQRFYANRGQSPYTFNINDYMRDQQLGGQGGR
jgi:hypothetical protein